MYTSFHKLAQQFSVFSLCSPSLKSALLFHSTIISHMKVSFFVKRYTFCMAPVQQLGEASWSVVCAAMVFAVLRLCNIFISSVNSFFFYILFKI